MLKKQRHISLLFPLTPLARRTSGQDLGDGVWPLLAALLPRTATLQARLPPPPAGPPSLAGPRLDLAAWAARLARVTRTRTRSRCVRRVVLQVSGSGRVAAVSGVGAKGTSALQLAGGRALGPDGARRLAEVLRTAPPPLLASLDLRCRGDARAHA